MNSDFLAQSFQHQIDFHRGNFSCKKTKDFVRFPFLIIHIEKSLCCCRNEIQPNSNAAFHFVESKPFVKMVKTLNPRYILPGTKYFSKYSVPKPFIEAKKKKKE